MGSRIKCPKQGQMDISMKGTIFKLNHLLSIKRSYCHLNNHDNILEEPLEDLPMRRLKK